MKEHEEDKSSLLENQTSNFDLLQMTSNLEEDADYVFEESIKEDSSSDESIGNENYEADSDDDDESVSDEMLNDFVTKVKEFLCKNEDKTEINVEDIVVYIQQESPEYINLTPECINDIVIRAYEIINANETNETDKEDNDSINDNIMTEPNNLIEPSNSFQNKDTEARDTEALLETLNKDESQENTVSQVQTESPVDSNLNDDFLEQIIQEESKQKLRQESKKESKDNLISNASNKSSKGLKKKHKNKISPNQLVIKKKFKYFNIVNSLVKFSDIGGNEKLIDIIAKKLQHLKSPEAYQKFKTSLPKGFLFHGPSGCGKTLLAHAIAGEFQIPLLKVMIPELIASTTEQIDLQLKKIFEQANILESCILFFDEMDILSYDREITNNEKERYTVIQLGLFLDKLDKTINRHKMLVIGAINKINSLDASLRVFRRFSHEFYLSAPNRDERASILKIHTAKMKLAPEVCLQKVANLSAGFTGSDLVALAHEAQLEAVHRVSIKNQPTNQTIRIEECDFESAFKIIHLTIKKQGTSVTIPDTTWNEIGSLQDIRKELQLEILAPIRYSEQFERIGLKSATGILLCGPSGCGKTLLTKAIANETGLNLIVMNGFELLNKYINKKEYNLREVFELARNAAPCIVFFDDLDVICPSCSRSTLESEIKSSIVNDMLVEMDSLKDCKDIFIMAASNKPDIIDPALLKTGRFSKIIYVGLPDFTDRYNILQVLTKDGTSPKLAGDVSLVMLANDGRCDGFSGADLERLIQQAQKEFLDGIIEGLPDTEFISLKCFKAAFDVIKPSVQKKDFKRFKKFKKLYSVKKRLTNVKNPEKITTIVTVTSPSKDIVHKTSKSSKVSILNENKECTNGIVNNQQQTYSPDYNTRQKSFTKNKTCNVPDKKMFQDDEEDEKDQERSCTPSSNTRAGRKRLQTDDLNAEPPVIKKSQRKSFKIVNNSI